ncbi:TPA: hypothetical protein JHK28_003508 [Enterobacter cloacae]|nr:hypothetical protein [Enterobacter cloacae]HCM9153625.1 hypothetical protein [Enterobacter cloacae subsp. cloacae]PAN76210.1 hypothetical protein CIW68_07000 [Enterobacter cloacae]RTO07433.1 hypothetical protein EKN72_20455 [Enterobacter cloacae]RTO60437.1 hypothetical protein EKN66_20410 [Enterobacter cloacae]
MNFKMSWTLDEIGGNKQIQNLDMVLNQFKLIQGKKGTLTLDILNSSDDSAEMLQIRTENGYYLITLGEIVEDEYQVRTYWDSSKPDTGILILGDYWPESQLTKDSEFIVKILKEFFDTGNVSKELLS